MYLECSLQTEVSRKQFFYAEKQEPDWPLSEIQTISQRHLAHQLILCRQELQQVKMLKMKTQ